MAMSTIEEPRVKVSEKIHATPNLLDINGSSNVGGVIVAPRGPRIAYVAGPHDFLSKYTVDGEVPRNADKTFINAYYLSFSAGLVLARAMNTQAVEGMVFKPEAVHEVKLLLQFDSSALWGISLFKKFFYHDDTSTQFDTFKNNARNIFDDATKTYPFNDVVSKIEGDNANPHEYVSNLADLASKVEAQIKSQHKDDSKYDHLSVVYSSIAGGLVISGYGDAIGNIDNVVDKDGDTILKLNVNPSLVNPNSNVIGLMGYPLRFKDGTALTKSITMKLHIQNKDSWAFTYGTMAYYHGPIDKTAFGDYSLKLCSSIDNVVNSINNIKGMSAELISTKHVPYKAAETDKQGAVTAPAVEEHDECEINIQYSEGNRLYVATSEDLCVNIDKDVLKQSVNDAQDNDYTSDTKYGTGRTLADSEHDWMLMVRPKDPQDSDIYGISIRKGLGKLFNITLDNSQTANSYDVSLLADELDESGSNAYIENLNAVESNFEMTVNPDYQISKSDAFKMIKGNDPTSSDKDTSGNLTLFGTTSDKDTLIGEEAFTYLVPKATQAFTFGDSGLSLAASKSTNCLISALYELEDQEQYDIENIAPFGMTDLTFIKNYILVGKNNDWFSPFDIPYNKTNANSIKSYCLNVDPTSNTMGGGPFDKNTGLTGWLNYIAWTTLYYTKVYNNRAQRKEFAPVFDITNGILDYTNPVYMLGKEDRKKLLNFKCPVNFVVYDMKHSCYYSNDNRTYQPEINIVSEEQNRRIVNKIKKDLKRLMGRFKGRYNTVTTRNDVISQIDLYFQSEIYSQEYAPNKHNIICDETNNTDDIIAANKLAVTVQVQLYNAIKFIDVLVDVFPLNVDFNQ